MIAKRTQINWICDLSCVSFLFISSFGRISQTQSKNNEKRKSNKQVHNTSTERKIEITAVMWKKKGNNTNKHK